MTRYENTNISEVKEFFIQKNDIEQIEIINEIEKIINKFNTRKHAEKFYKLFIDTFNRFPYKIVTGSDGIKSLIRNTTPFTSMNQPNDYSNLVQFLNNLRALHSLQILDTNDKRIVLVGPNGAGKTTLLRNLYPHVNSTNSYLVIPAERIVEIENSYNVESFDSFKTNIENTIARNGLAYLNIGPVINLLKERRRVENEQRIAGQGKTENAKKVLDEWNHLSKTREIKFNPELKAYYKDKAYELSSLSSGEKTILAFLCVVLLMKEYDYYFIDEPENTLNPAIVSELCDYLEKQRPNSVFVYLTHNSDFVASRRNAKLYWIAGYNGKDWSFKELKTNSELPSELAIKLVGIKSSILFCESDDLKKYDARAFSILFNDYKIVPSGGCDAVKRYANAYGVSGFPNDYMGIIDRDYNFSFDDLDNEKNLKKKHIYVLPYFEIENMLFNEDIIKGTLLLKGVSDEDANERVEAVKQSLFNDFSKEIDKLATKYVASERHRESDYRERINALENIEGFKQLYSESHLSNEDIDERFNKYRDFFNQIISENNFKELLKYYDCKGMFNKYSQLLQLEPDEYKELVFAFLESEQAKEVVKQLKEEIVG